MSGARHCWGILGMSIRNLATACGPSICWGISGSNLKDFRSINSKVKFSIFVMYLVKRTSCHSRNFWKKLNLNYNKIKTIVRLPSRMGTQTQSRLMRICSTLTTRLMVQILPQKINISNLWWLQMRGALIDLSGKIAGHPWPLTKKVCRFWITRISISNQVPLILCVLPKDPLHSRTTRIA